MTPECKQVLLEMMSMLLNKKQGNLTIEDMLLLIGYSVVIGNLGPNDNLIAMTSQHIIDFVEETMLLFPCPPSDNEDVNVN